MTEVTAPARKQRTPAEAEAEFRAHVAERGGVVVGEYKSVDVGVEVRCQNGHASFPSLSNMRKKGRGLCRACVARTPAETEAAFRARVAELGGTVVGEYVNARTPVETRCGKGHTGATRPDGVLNKGHGICTACKVTRVPTGAPAFLARMEAIGATVLGEYVNNATPVKALCSGGHITYVRPGKLQQGCGVCLTCAGQNPDVAEARIRELIEAAGGVVVGAYRGSFVPLDVLCSRGHSCSPMPANVRKGQGLCVICAHDARSLIAWDAFYVVQDPNDGTVKFGITSGNAKRRIRRHARDGYTDVLRLHTGLPGTVAPDLERNIKAALRDARVTPTRGVEYFPESALSLILDLVDHHPDLTTPEAS